MERFFWRATAVVFCVAAGLTVAQAEPSFNLQEVGHGVWSAVATPHSAAGSNAGFVIGTDGVLVVDSFEDPAVARELLAAIKTKTPLPVRFVVNTHYHLDHVAGNAVFAEAGATLLAQRNVRQWERTENLKFFGDKLTPAQRQSVESYALPELLYRDGVEVYLGDRRVVVRVMPGHTGGDSVVVVPDAEVVFTGDLFWNHCLPNLIDADTRMQIETNEILAREYPSAAFVPGHGEVARAADVRAFAGYLQALRLAVGAAPTHAGAAWVAPVVAGLKKNYGTWNYFDYFVVHNVEQTAAELGASKTRPTPAP